MSATSALTKQRFAANSDAISTPLLSGMKLAALGLSSHDEPRFAAHLKGEIVMFTNEERNEASGLCMTCNHASFCMYLANANSSIWCCEEFDDRPPVIAPEENTQEVKPELTEEPQRLVAEYTDEQLRKAS